jgi:F-type H+-transporting ATPase subunit delta
MAELRTLARPYAKAVYEYARAGGTLDQWSSSLDLLSSVVSEGTVRKLLDSPELSTGQQAAAIADLCGDELDDKARNLVALLAEYRRLPLLPYIAQQYRLLKAQQEKAVDVELISAAELDDNQRQQFSQALSRRLDRRINISVAIDKSLIGGVVIRTGDTVIDGSIRGRLTKLAQALNS